MNTQYSRCLMRYWICTVNGRYLQEKLWEVQMTTWQDNVWSHEVIGWVETRCFGRFFSAVLSTREGTMKMWWILNNYSSSNSSESGKRHRVDEVRVFQATESPSSEAWSKISRSYLLLNGYLKWCHCIV